MWPKVSSSSYTCNFTKICIIPQLEPPSSYETKKKKKSFMQVDNFQIKYYLHSFIRKGVLASVLRISSLSFTSLCWLICAQRCLPQVTLAILQKSISSPSWSLQVHMKPKKRTKTKKNKSFMQVDSFQIKYYLHSFIHKKLMVMMNRLWCSQRTKMKKI